MNRLHLGDSPPHAEMPPRPAGCALSDKGNLREKTGTGTALVLRIYIFFFLFSLYMRAVFLKMIEEN